MKRLSRFFTFIFTNILFLLVFILVCDHIVYQVQKKIYSKHIASNIPGFKYIAHPSVFIKSTKNYFNGDDFKGRLPDGLEYRNKTPLVIFGCSYAYGQYLPADKTFSHQLSDILKRPVYNRAIIGANPQIMYLQTTEDSFYEDVPKADTYIYVFFDDHYRRIHGCVFFIIQDAFHLCYKIVNGKLVQENYDNPVFNIIRSSYTIKFLYLHFINHKLKNEKNAENETNLFLKYLIEARNNIKTHYINEGDNTYDPKFIVILYNNFPIRFNDLLTKKLQYNNFIVIDTNDITDVDLNSEEYLFQDNAHPTEKAWELLTPKIIDSAKLK